MPLRLPKSRAEIRRLQSERKRAAVERATRSPFWKKRLPSVNLEKLDDPEVWRKIPILDKDTLRGLSDAQFYGEFCHAEHDGIAEYWRSGGVTGQPLFYPRSFRDIEVGLESFARTFDCAGAGRGERAHISFPLHLANLAEARGVELNSIKKIMTSAEPVSQAKRDKIERSFGAKLTDNFG